MKELSRQNAESETTLSKEYMELQGLPMAVSGLERTARELKDAKQDPFALWWACQAAHQALYKLLIANLEGTNYHRVLDPQALEDGRQKLVGFQEALRRSRQDSWMRQYVFSKTLALDESDYQIILKFHRGLRNPLEHFIPKSWCIEEEYIYAKLRTVAKALRQLALETRNAHWTALRNGRDLRERASEALRGIDYCLQDTQGSQSV